ncbi:MAG TPA: hypothetical protein VJM47_07635 [Nitrosospira sp.]|nr:hypothetical protein [Nitrosospira sp.]
MSVAAGANAVLLFVAGGVALQSHPALPRTWITARSTPSNYGF